MAEVDDLMAMFAAHPLMVVCRGPEHLTQAALAIGDRVRQWVETHPFLNRDEGYLQFIKRYCGAIISDEAGEFWATVHGFHPEVGYLDEYAFCTFDPTVTALDGRGLYQFALMQYEPAGPGTFLERRVLMGFYFDSSSARPWGVYRRTIIGSRPQSAPELVCGSFCEWLRRVSAGIAHRAEHAAAVVRPRE